MGDVGTVGGGAGGGAALALYLMLARSARQPGAAPAPASDWPPRPAGALVWLHAGGALALPAAVRLVQALRAEGTRAAAVITAAPEATGPEATGPTAPEGLPDDILYLPAPADALAPVRAFLDHWRPDLAAFVGGGLRPAALHQAWVRRIPLIHLDAPAPRLAAVAPRWVPGLARAAARCFGRILVRDAAARRAFERAGVAPVRIEIGGAMQDAPPPLPHAEAERAALAQLVATRPIWAALGLVEAEEAAIVEAHAAARRHSHRLLLVLSPDDPARGPAVAVRLAAAFPDAVARRGAEQEPDAETAVYVADTDGEDGLWLRLATIAFLGGTLAPGGARVLHPFAAAAFGAAVVHGPHLPQGLRRAADDLDAARAARAVAGAPDLAAAIGDLLAPDAAAACAHAAWEVISARDAATERAAHLLAETLAPGGSRRVE